MYNTEETLRAAGLINGDIAPAAQAVYASLSPEESDLLFTLASRLKAEEREPEVVAHEWSSPQAARADAAEATSCFCGAWSGSGSGSN